MKNIIPLFCLTCLMAACNNKPTEITNEKTRDTLVLVHRDTVVVIQQAGPPAPALPQPTPATKEPAIKENKPAPPAIPQKIAKNENASDTTYHYYVNKRVSVKITPWVDSERWVLLYDLKGVETYRQQEVHKSYTERAELKFHPNGAVSTMEIHTNPGASMYWYETTITFGTTNDPIQKLSERKPIDRLEMNQPWEYWDSKKKEWRKQEVQE